jgi:hypothetical protein
VELAASLAVQLTQLVGLLVMTDGVEQSSMERLVMQTVRLAGVVVRMGRSPCITKGRNYGILS